MESRIFAFFSPIIFATLSNLKRYTSDHYVLFVPPPPHTHTHTHTHTHSPNFSFMKVCGKNARGKIAIGKNVRGKIAIGKNVRAKVVKIP